MTRPKAAAAALATAFLLSACVVDDSPSILILNERDEVILVTIRGNQVSYLPPNSNGSYGNIGYRGTGECTPAPLIAMTEDGVEVDRLPAGACDEDEWVIR